MTTTALFGYLETPYLDTIYPYLTEFALASTGMRAQLVISTQKATAMRAKGQIVNHLDAIGARAKPSIVNFIKAEAMRCTRIVNPIRAVGMRTKSQIVQHKSATGMRARGTITTAFKAMGEKALLTKLTHILYGNYLVNPYLTDAYLGDMILAIEGMRSKGFISNRLNATGMRAKGVLSHPKATGMRSKVQIKDHLKALGMRSLSIRNFAMAMSAFVQLYNTNNLRILSTFASRGAATTGGTNAWGNPKGTGQNWSSNSTAAGDFDPSNLNTDIDEQVWRSATSVLTGIILKCDTEQAQGVFVDTLALRNHNLTSSANIRFEASNNSGFSTVPFSATLSPIADNMYWIAPDAPLHGYKYWRIVIDDPTNPNAFLQIGTVLFGRADIFQGETHTDEVDFSYKDFADKIETEGFTSVSNSRALKKTVHLEFRVLRFDLGNFKILRALSTKFRTTHKCLWIPTPDPVDMGSTSRFAVFAKLQTVPAEKHNWKGSNADYVDVVVDLDESL